MSTADHSAERVYLEKAIAVQEGLRGTVDDAIIDATITSLKEKLADLDPPPLQRKLVTILFMDIAGHTALTHHLDPEEQMAVVDPAIARLANIVSAHGGHVARYQGDGFKAVFGLPVAGEDDALEAVRAGLGIVAEAKRISAELVAERGLPGFNVRVGLSTGLVFAGGETEGEDTIKGMTVNLAARLESAAPVGGVLISEQTYRHVRGVFELEERELIEAKGFKDPVRVFRVLGEKERMFRRARRGVEGLQTRMVGREKELASLQEAFEKTTSERRTAVVTVVGEAGVGKSRLVLEFSDWLDLRAESIWLFRGRSTQQTKGIPLHLLRGMLAERFQILESDTLDVVREKFSEGIRSFLKKDGEIKAHVLGTWLGFEMLGDAFTEMQKEDSEERRRQALVYLGQLFEAAGNERPVVVLLDDIHWADGSSLDALMHFVTNRPAMPLLLVCLARPSLYEWRAEWGKALPTHYRMDLTPLSGQDSVGLAKEILRKVEPPSEILLKLVSRRAEGNPFYAEELVKMLVDDGVIGVGPEVWEVQEERLTELEVPATLTGVLQARLDRLSAYERRAVQQAAVIGRTFWDRALLSMTRADESQPEKLQISGEAEETAALKVLQAREFVFREPESAFEHTEEYIFKHAILRDVAYETVLKRIRGKYHALVADWLAATAEANGRCDEFAALIGDHYRLAGREEKAPEWYFRAGRLAMQSYAYSDAERYLTLALEFTPREDTATRFEILINRLVTYAARGMPTAWKADLDRLARLAPGLGPAAQARAAIAMGDYFENTSDFESELKYAQEAIFWANQVGDVDLAARGQILWADALWRTGYPEGSMTHYKEALQLGREAGNRATEAVCLDLLGIGFWSLGKYTEARTHHEQALAICQDIGYKGRESLCILHLATVHWTLGEFKEAREKYLQAAALFRDVESTWGEYMCNWHLGLTALFEGEFRSARDHLMQSLAVSRKAGDRWIEGLNLTFLGIMAREVGDEEEARRLSEQALAIQREINDQFGKGYSLHTLGVLAFNRGNYEEAMTYHEIPTAFFHENGQPSDEGKSLICLGAAALYQGDVEKAESSYMRALKLFDRLGIIVNRVECHAGLAKVKLMKGEQEASRTHIEPALAHLRKTRHLNGANSFELACHLLRETLLELGDHQAAAEEVLEIAGRNIEKTLELYGDIIDRERYLSLPHRSKLYEAWQKSKKGTSTS